MKEKDILSLIEQYNATGRTAYRYPRKKEISLNGRTMPQDKAIQAMQSTLGTTGDANWMNWED